MRTLELSKGVRWVATTALLGVAGTGSALGGTIGSYMSSSGYGKAVSAITFGGGKTAATSQAMTGPCSAVNPTADFSCTTSPIPLPSGTPSSVYCQTKGFPNYRWSIQSYVTAGATADNPDLESRITVTPAPCASYSMETAATFTDANSGSITVNAIVTPGAAIWLRGYEMVNGATPTDLADLIANGVLRWDMLMVGPFNLDQGNCTAMTLPFTTLTGHANLYFVADAVAKSIPFEVTCPGNVVIGCSDPLAYPAAVVSGGCGGATVTYNPPATALVHGVPTTVTATATDGQGNTASCSFTALRERLTFSGFKAPINGTGGSCAAPLRTLTRGGIIPVLFSATMCPTPILTTIPPTISIKRCSTGAACGSGNFRRSGSDWSYNWNTASMTAGVYELTATMQDRTTRVVYLNLQ